MGGVFVNYRTGDGDWAATFIARELAVKFGADNVFFASKSIRVGEDFVVRILDRLRKCDVFLAVIGRQWLTMTDRQGNPRLASPDDWVRREILEAFDRGLRVIPVFLDGTPPLTESDLPDDIAMLARAQYLRLHHRNDDRDIARMIDELVEILSGRQTGISAKFEVAAASTVNDVTAEVLGDIAEAHYPITVPAMPDREIPAALADRLASYLRDMTPLLRLAAAGVGPPEHDELWIRAAERILNRVRRRSSSVWIDAEAYPALLFVYVVGIAGAAKSRDDLVYRILHANAAGRPAIKALTLRHVVDPRYAAEFPEWHGRRQPYHPLSKHLHNALRPVFHDVLVDHEYDTAFEDYEYLRTLLELHESAFSSLGGFAVDLANGRSEIHKRMAGRLTALLATGAFDGSAANLTTTRHQLDAALQGRYR